MLYYNCNIGTNDAKKAKVFYDAVLGIIGVKEGELIVNKSGYPRVIYEKDGEIFIVNEPINGEPANVGNGSTIGFRCRSQEEVDKFHATVVAQGGVRIEDPVGPRSEHRYTGYFRDLDGNKLAAQYIKEDGPL